MQLKLAAWHALYIHSVCLFMVTARKHFYLETILWRECTRAEPSIWRSAPLSRSAPAWWQRNGKGFLLRRAARRPSPHSTSKFLLFTFTFAFVCIKHSLTHSLASFYLQPSGTYYDVFHKLSHALCLKYISGYFVILVNALSGIEGNVAIRWITSLGSEKKLYFIMLELSILGNVWTEAVLCYPKH
jgi:hypothetical protein